MGFNSAFKGLMIHPLWCSTTFMVLHHILWSMHFGAPSHLWFIHYGAPPQCFMYYGVAPHLWSMHIAAPPHLWFTHYGAPPHL
jgi:hypothetical protein